MSIIMMAFNLRREEELENVEQSFIDWNLMRFYKKKKHTEQTIQWNFFIRVRTCAETKKLFSSSKPSTCLQREPIKVNLESNWKTTRICEHPQKGNFPLNFLKFFLNLKTITQCCSPANFNFIDVFKFLFFSLKSLARK